MSGENGIIDIRARLAQAEVDLTGKQPMLVSGTTIKTLNGVSLLGAGDIAIVPGGGVPIPANTLTGNNTALPALATPLTVTQVKALLGYTPAELGAAATTHLHVAANVTDFSEAVDDRIAALLVSGTNITITYNDAANTLTIAAADTGAIRAFGQLVASYLLLAVTTVQKLFNWSANGAVTLATGRYKFTSMVYILGMSATTGNAAFSLAGTAVLTNRVLTADGVDSTTPLNAAATSKSASITSATPTSMVTAAIGTGMFVTVTGTFTVTVAGTVIPSIQLVTTSAATVQAGSFFECERITDALVNTVGSWS